MEKVFLYVAFALLTFGLCGFPNPFRKVVRKVEEPPPQIEPTSSVSLREIPRLNIQGVFIAVNLNGQWVSEREMKDPKKIQALFSRLESALPCPSKSEFEIRRIRILYSDSTTQEIVCSESVLKWQGSFFKTPVGLLDLLYDY